MRAAGDAILVHFEEAHSFGSSGGTELNLLIIGAARQIKRRSSLLENTTRLAVETDEIQNFGGTWSFPGSTTAIAIHNSACG
jgi:hypothetical protein